MFEKQCHNKENILSTDKGESVYMNMWLICIDMATKETENIENIKLCSCDETEISNAFKGTGLPLSKND